MYFYSKLDTLDGINVHLNNRNYILYSNQCNENCNQKTNKKTFWNHQMN
jgi:hypothetical protein